MISRTVTCCLSYINTNTTGTLVLANEAEAIVLVPSAFFFQNGRVSYGLKGSGHLYFLSMNSPLKLKKFHWCQFYYGEDILSPGKPRSNISGTCNVRKYKRVQTPIYSFIY